MALAENHGNRRNILPTQAKVDRVTELKEKLENSSIVISAGFSGMGSNQMVDLRRRMRDGGVEFVVIKNNLLNLAADAADIPQLKDIITGQTGIALGYEDPVAAAKTVNDAAVAGGILRINGAIVDRGDTMAASEVSRLAALPPRPGAGCSVAGQHAIAAVWSAKHTQRSSAQPGIPATGPVRPVTANRERCLASRDLDSNQANRTRNTNTRRSQSWQ